MFLANLKHRNGVGETREVEISVLFYQKHKSRELIRWEISIVSLQPTKTF